MSTQPNPLVRRTMARRIGLGICGGVGLAAIVLSAAWLRAANFSKVGPVAYWRYPIRHVKTFEVDDSLRAELSDLRFVDQHTLSAASVESVNTTLIDLRGPSTVDHSEDVFNLLMEPTVSHADDVSTLAFVDHKLGTGLMATNGQKSRLITFGKAKANDKLMLHYWAQTASQADKQQVNEQTTLGEHPYEEELRKAYEMPQMAQPHIAMSAEGARFAIAGKTETDAKIWLAEVEQEDNNPDQPGEFVHELTVPSPVTAISYSHDGNLFATTHEDNTAYLWNTQTGKVIRPLNYTVPSPPRGNSKQQIIFSTDDSRVAMVDTSAAYLWKTDTGELLNTFTLTNEQGKNIWNRTRSVAISTDNKWIASDAGHSSKIYFWDTQSGELLRILRAAHTDAIAFSPDNTRFASGSNFADITLWELPDQLR
ncbi:MAG: hypothetical protein AAFU53_18365 [Cyanobacteria bacterium J06632_3]